MNSFYCHQLCYGYLNKWKTRVIVQSHYIQRYTKSGFFCLINTAYVVEELNHCLIIVMLNLLTFECSCIVGLSKLNLLEFQRMCYCRLRPNSWLSDIYKAHSNEYIYILDIYERCVHIWVLDCLNFEKEYFNSLKNSRDLYHLVTLGLWKKMRSGCWMF